MKPILIIDNYCPKPYDLHTLETEAMGGTEATVIRIAEKLSEKVPVTVFQHNRNVETRTKNVTYSPRYTDFVTLDWQAIILVRDPVYALTIKPLVKDTPIWIWLHDLVTVTMLIVLKSLSDADIGFITVSDFQTRELLDACKEDPYFPAKLKIARIYNPIADDLKPDQTPIDRNKLIFASSFHKGLKQTVDMFKLAKEKNPHFKLYISNPSYFTLNQIEEVGVVLLGGLKHRDNIHEIRSALCLFYPNHVYPETFGIVLAEANAVGTPVLTHPFGSASEVLQNKDQLVNSHNSEAFLSRLMEWHDGKRPKVHTSESFRMSHVIKEWEKLLHMS